jgi:hypothetical protein
MHLLLMHLLLMHLLRGHLLLHLRRVARLLLRRLLLIGRLRSCSQQSILV